MLPILALTNLILSIGIAMLYMQSKEMKSKFIEMELKEAQHAKRLLSILETAEKFTEKQRKDVADIKRRLTQQEKKLEATTDQCLKIVKETRKAHANITKECEKIAHETAFTCKNILHDFDRGAKNLGNIYVNEADKVIKWVRDIARDFYMVAAQLRDGTIKDITIISEETYMAARKLKK